MSVVAALAAPILVLAAMAQEPPPETPLATAPDGASNTLVPGLDDAPLQVAPGAEPKAEVSTSVAAKPLSVESRTMVQGQTLQIVLGQRALFMLDDQGWPVLLKVEEGKLAAAHPEGAVEETFAPPPRGQFAAALDGSAKVRATVLKVWNETDRALDYGAIALVMTRGNVTPTPAPVCAVPPRSIRTETWRRPIVAAGLTRFKETAKANACDQAG